MQYLILGLLALSIGLLAAQGFARANTAAVARQLRTIAGVGALTGAGVLTVRGMLGYAFPLAMLGSWLLWGQGMPGWSRQKSAGQVSRVVTDHLEMELEHDTGAMCGRVLKGLFQGRELENLKPVEVALLWQDCRFTDPQSAQLLEAYLDRIHPTWREDVARGEQSMSGGSGGRMTAQEACDILGLQPGAGPDEVRRAHRELMLKLHPDRGGSTYLAAKVNEAKDVLLERRV